jgi:hypothetical protein
MVNRQRLVIPRKEVRQERRVQQKYKNLLSQVIDTNDKVIETIPNT